MSIILRSQGRCWTEVTALFNINLREEKKETHMHDSMTWWTEFLFQYEAK